MDEIKTMQLSQFQEFSSERLVSKLLHDSENSRVVLFCLEPSQVLSPHITTSEVIFLVVDGTGTIIVGEGETEANAGTLVVCPPQTRHGLKAGSRLVVLAVIAPRP